ncbi:hypothetical protein NC651_003545 [Populus alba x Populus x berolinensis]|nr:hypothetical protein NC651_003545 [Populus alba x Populus x berolinensis]
MKPQIANTIEITFTPPILSLNTNTARTGTIGNPKTLMELENKEETSKTNPTQPIAKTCQDMAVPTKFIT